MGFKGGWVPTPTNQLCLNLQSLAKKQAHYGRRPTRSAKRARRATGAKSTGVQPSASPRDQQHGQHNARVQRVLSTNVLGISPPSSKGDGWGVGRGRQVFRPVTFPCLPQPQSDLQLIFHLQTIQGIYNGSQQSESTSQTNCAKRVC